jgi:hypothetical protein
MSKKQGGFVQRPGYVTCRILNLPFSFYFTNASAGSKRRSWRSLAFAACAGFSISIFLSKIFTGMACSHCYGLPLYSFHRFKKKAHFKFWINQKAAVQFFSTDFNLLIFSRFNFKILILQFDLLESKINQKSDDNQSGSGFRPQFPEDST